MVHAEIGQRVGVSLPAGVTQAQIAAQIGLSAEKFSRALNGKRAFSSVEVAQLADVLGVDVHWLITGVSDPHRLKVVARHDFDPNTGVREVPGRLRDQPVLDDVALAYRQAAAAGWDAVLALLSGDVDEVRGQLGGEGFVRRLADRLEAGLDVDVVRLPMLSTAYSFVVAGRRVIVIPATGNWFRENWSLAHELGHFVAGHHEGGDVTAAVRDHHELVANTFAADLLLPAPLMRSIDWVLMTSGELAELVWSWGVSTDALAKRLSRLNVDVADDVWALLQLSTQALLRRHWAGQHADGIDEITQRMDEASTRRFPRRLQEAHMELIAVGAVRKYTLAWMLGIDAESLEVEEPCPPASIDADELAAALGH